jgi:hypothetical protein
VVLPLLALVGSRPIAATVPDDAAVDPSGVTAADCPTFNDDRDVAGTLTVTRTAPGATITMEEVPELTPATNGWLAILPLMGLVSVAPARFLFATSSATWAAATAA